MPVALILTAAVQPTASGRVDSAAPTVRLAEYRAAISHWLRLSAAGLVSSVTVAETSGWPIDDLVPARHDARLDVMSVAIPSPLLARGKGAAEAHALDVVIGRLADSAAEDFTIYKCTGRLWVRNAARVLTPLPARSVRVRATADLSYCDSRFYGAGGHAWRTTLKGLADEIDEDRGLILEQVLGQRLRCSAPGAGVDVERFAARPALVGRSGTTGATYDGRMARLRAVGAAPLEAVLRRYSRIKQF
ncbi:MAG: hypothetical protein EPO13_05665 [Actinomycetota bacterium]|nr:MAG: hypothetical protein EPO13_05665 [Actinomycetota bacterium]